MKITASVLTFFLCLVLYSPAFADSNLRCGTRLISIGDTKAEVLLKCSNPMLKEAVGEKEKSRRIDMPLTSDPDTVAHGSTSSSQNTAVVQNKESETLLIEQWTYNQGSGKLLKILVFEGGELVAINHGERN